MQAMEAEFGDAVNVTRVKTFTHEGALEVSVKGGPLLHSKLHGDGHCNTEEKMARLLAALRAWLRRSGD